METISLKTLSNKILERNRPGNFVETPGFHAGKLRTEKFPLLGEKVDFPLEMKNVTLPATLGDFQSLFEKAVVDVGACYVPGTLEMIRGDFPDLAGEIEQAEDQINELWLKARKETVDLGAFEEALGKWKRLHLRAIQFFSLMEKTCMSHTVKPGSTIYG